MRAQTCQHIRKHTARFQQLFDNYSEYKAWLTKSGSQTTWAEGKVIQACAEKLCRPIVVWEKKTDSEGIVTYNRFVLAPRFSRGFACGSEGKVVCLILCDKHFTALLPPADSAFPPSWLRETPDVVIQLDGGTSSERALHSSAVEASSSSAVPPQVTGVPAIVAPPNLRASGRSDCDLVVHAPSVSGGSGPQDSPRPQVVVPAGAEVSPRPVLSPGSRSSRHFPGCGRPLKRLRGKTLCSVASSACSCSGSGVPGAWSPSRSLPDLPTPSAHSLVPPSLRTQSLTSPLLRLILWSVPMWPHLFPAPCALGIPPWRFLLGLANPTRINTNRMFGIYLMFLILG